MFLFTPRHSGFQNHEILTRTMRLMLIATKRLNLSILHMQTHCVRIHSEGHHIIRIRSDDHHEDLCTHVCSDMRDPSCMGQIL